MWVVGLRGGAHLGLGSHERCADVAELDVPQPSLVVTLHTNVCVFLHGGEQRFRTAWEHIQSHSCVTMLW